MTGVDPDDEAEIDRRLDAQLEYGEALMRKLQPGFVLKEMLIDAAIQTLEIAKASCAE